MKTSRDFCVWLRGYLEGSKSEGLPEDRVMRIKQELHEVFIHEIDPAMGTPEHLERLDEAHHGLRPSDFKMRC